MIDNNNVDAVAGWKLLQRIQADSGRVQRETLHPRRITDSNQRQPEWREHQRDEVQHEVRLKR